MGLAKLALIFSAALAMAVTTGEAAAGGRSGGGRSGGGHAHSGSGHHSHFHHRGGVFFGGYLYTGPYYYYPAYYHPVPLYYPEPADPYWYYCRAANAYYPYVQNCPGGWERYLPSPQPPLG